MTKEDKPVSPLEPVEKTSYACGVCGTLKDTEDEARKCAMDDTGTLEVSKVVSRTEKGYPNFFIGSFRTGVSLQLAAVKSCSMCEGTGEDKRENGNTFPCTKCDGTGWIVAK